VVDVSDFALRYGVFKQICLTRQANSGKIWNFPTGDAFAGAHKDFHKPDRFLHGILHRGCWQMPWSGIGIVWEVQQQAEHWYGHFLHSTY
jgi:hypothetical protein